MTRVDHDHAADVSRSFPVCGAARCVAETTRRTQWLKLPVEQLVVRIFQRHASPGHYDRFQIIFTRLCRCSP